MSRREPTIFDDNGSSITVDVHGCSVRDAMYIVRRTVQEAFWKGRTHVEVNHGASTSAGSKRIIKTELEQRLEEGVYKKWVAGKRPSNCGGRCTLGLMIGQSLDPIRIHIKDVVRRHV